MNRDDAAVILDLFDKDAPEGREEYLPLVMDTIQKFFDEMYDTLAATTGTLMDANAKLARIEESLDKAARS